MSERLGYIYLITNKINGQQYVGQTSRDIETRFSEHCFDDRSKSKIHLAIKEFGWQNFKVEQLEAVPLAKLDERESYWIEQLQTRVNGYNVAKGGHNPLRDYLQVKVVENGMIFDSRHDLARQLSNITSWGFGHLVIHFKNIIDNPDKDFCGYHFISCYAEDSELTDILDIEEWAKTLNARFQGKKIYCPELDLEFDTTGEAAKYFFDKGYYQGASKTPIQSIISAMGKHLHGGTDKLDCIGGLSFIYLPGSTKNKGAIEPFVCKKIYCPQLNMTFDSQTIAARYMIDNNIWTKIKLKTAKLRISDIIRGVASEYRGYEFKEVNE